MYKNKLESAGFKAKENAKCAIKGPKILLTSLNNAS
jgi:hypothetical protein